jgi:hypothetical protein
MLLIIEGNMKVYIFSILVAVCSCKSRDLKSSLKSVDKKGLDVNDVSVLFPYPESVEEMNALLSSTTILGDKSELIPQPLFMEIMKLYTSNGPEGLKTVSNGKNLSLPGIDAHVSDPLGIVKTRENWRVSGFRFDPCAPKALQLVKTGEVLTLPSSCSVQIRLILNPSGENISGAVGLTDLFTKPVDTQDASIHMVFEFPKEAAKPLAMQLLTIRNEKSIGRELGPHPVLLRRDSEAASFRKGIDEFLKSNLSLDKLKLLAFQNTSNLPFGVGSQWLFFGAAVIPDQQTNKLEIKLIPQKFGDALHSVQTMNPFPPRDEPDRLSQLRNLVTPNFGTSKPNSSQHFNIEEFFGEEPKQEIADELAAVDNPKLSQILLSDQNNNNHRDCISCHTAGGLVAQSRENLSPFITEIKLSKHFLKSKNRFSTDDPRYQGITGFINPGNLNFGSWNVRNFGYQDGFAVASFRTLNETVEAVALTNELLGLENPAPKLKCTDSDVWECLFTVGNNEKAPNNINAESCLKKCR